eukprot:6042383-Pyramimonas_sp.AAC.1
MAREEVEVVPGPIAPEFTKVEGAALVAAETGRVAQFFIHAHDKVGNAITHLPEAEAELLDVDVSGDGDVH